MSENQVSLFSWQLFNNCLFLLFSSYKENDYWCAINVGKTLVTIHFCCTIWTSSRTKLAYMIDDWYRIEPNPRSLSLWVSGPQLFPPHPIKLCINMVYICWILQSISWLFVLPRGDNMIFYDLGEMDHIFELSKSWFYFTLYEK